MFYVFHYQFHIYIMDNCRMPNLFIKTTFTGLKDKTNFK